jgi:hypothetical protein
MNNNKTTSSIVDIFHNYSNANVFNMLKKEELQIEVKVVEDGFLDPWFPTQIF